MVTRHHLDNSFYSEHKPRSQYKYLCLVLCAKYYANKIYMDIAAFSDDSFDATDWINTQFNNFKSSDDGTKDKDAFISTYVSKLQLYVQQVNFAVEETSQQLVGNLPRIIKDVKNLHTDVQSLQKRMGELRSEISSVQEETGDCMESLQKLNNLQTKLQVSKESLQESDGWGNLISELEESFERNDIMAVSKKLVSLQKSLFAQEKLAGHTDRLTQVEDFKNRLEALASPSIVQSFSAGDIENSQKYVRIFDGIDRLPQLKQYYRAVQKSSIQQHWKENLDLADNSNQFLATFYDYLLEICQKQSKWCVQVFGEDSGCQPFVVVAEVLPALQPTRESHILQVLKNSNDRLEILQLFAVANRTFVTQLNLYLENSSIVLTADECKFLAESIFEYFDRIIQQYPRIEETQLYNQVERLFVNHSNASDAIRHLEDCNRKIFEWLYESLERCNQITNDLAIFKMVVFLSGVLKRILENFVKTQRQVNLCIAGNEQNWALLQNCMSLLQCLSDFQSKLNKFEKFLHNRMSLLDQKIKSISNSTKASGINIYAVYDRTELKRIATSICDFQQKLNDKSQAISLGIFPHIYESLKSNFMETHDITLTILLHPIDQQLRNIQPTDNQHNPSVAEMPTFSFAPQECITQIGQYLLTLPQHLEPLLLAPSALLKVGLEMCNIKYSQNIPCADVLLSLVVEQCCVMYQSQILQIKSINATSAKQLAVDIEYLNNVVEELGLSITQHLNQILILLKAKPENYLALSSGCEPRLVTAIRQMRNIISKE